MDALRWVLLLIGIGVFILIFLFSKKKATRLEMQNNSLQTDVSIDDDFGKVQPGLSESVSLDELAQDMRLDNEAASVGKALSAKQKNNAGDDHSPKNDEMMIIFYLLEKNNGKLTGSKIIDALESVGMRYGDMKIFHYYDADLSEQKESVFSIANIAEPGWFDLVSINQVSTPGMAMFMKLPCSMASIKAFDAMLTVIEKLLQILPLTLKDKKHDVVSQQTLSHLREEVVEFERKRSIARKA